MSTFVSEVAQNTPPVCLLPWLENSNRLVSLWDIVKRFDLGTFADLVAVLRDAQGQIAINRQTGFNEVDLKWIKRIAMDGRNYCVKVGFKEAERQCMMLAGRASSPPPLWEMADVQSDLRNLQESIERDLKSYSYVVIEAVNAPYLEHDELFGQNVLQALPGARGDVKEAGNCIAVGLDTAAVFHLMRATEHGLRYLAKRLKVKLTHSGRPQPIESADWNKVITGIRNKIASARTLTPSKKRTAQLSHWSDGADHCEYMKDIWRNAVSHTGKPYDRTEAIRSFERVRAFTQFVCR